VLLRALSRAATGGAAKRIPALKFLAVAEIAMLASRHVSRLDAAERRRLGALLTRAGRERTMTAAERDELLRLARKLEMRSFAGGVADALSPVPLPRILREGRRRRRR
jgi:hypothetical protein